MSYADWRNVFYPKGIKAADYLSYYSRIFNAVEIDSSFHAVPKQETVIRWGAISPPGFRICMKMPQQISHSNDPTTSIQMLREFMQIVKLLEEKSGPILIQFPPTFRFEQLKMLEKFLAFLPGGFRYAVEVRHPSWYSQGSSQEPALAGLLREFRISWTATDYPGLPVIIHRTTDFQFIRWIGQHGSYARHSHERYDRTDRLKEWIKEIQIHLDDIEELFGFFNNDYAGFAPATANRMKSLLGLPLQRFELPSQASLF